MLGLAGGACAYSPAFLTQPKAGQPRLIPIRGCGCSRFFPWRDPQITGSCTCNTGQ